MKEIWIKIPKFPLYEVSNFGRIKSLRFNKEKILKIVNRKDGYQSVVISNEFGHFTFLIHKLVYDTFNNIHTTGYYNHIDHIDNNRSNNNLENLNLVTARENSLKINVKNKTSIYKGVSWDKYKNKWKASIRIKSKQKTIGYFNDEYDAYLSYKNFLKRLEL